MLTILLLLLATALLQEVSSVPLVVPNAMPWPFPNDAEMSTGTTSVQLSSNFEITTGTSPTNPTLTAAIQRYQNQAVGSHISNPANNGRPVLKQLLVQVCSFLHVL